MDIFEELEKLRQYHYICSDCWYSCPKSFEGCCNDDEADKCNCGADEHNIILDNIIKHLKNE